MTKRKISLLLVAVLLFLTVGGLSLWQARRFFSYPRAFALLGIENWQVWEFHDYFELDPNELQIVWDNRRLIGLDYAPFILDGNIFFPAAFLRERGIDPFIFWDEGAQTLFISTDTEIMRLYSQDVPLAFVRRSMDTDFIFEHRLEYNVLIITDRENPAGRPAVTTRRRAPVRYRPDLTAFITTQPVAHTDRLTVFGRDGDFYRVRTEDGLLGYVLADDIQFLEPPRPIPAEPPAPARAAPINLSWEMITAPQGNVTAMNNPLPHGLTVISPTWFNFDPYRLDGHIISFASHDYVAWAHASGVKVWAKIFDSTREISHAILTNHRAREYAIAQLIGFVQEYNLDGINVNFEHIRGTDGGYYVQFLRELAVEMRRIDSTLSVATFVPAPWFRHYHHDLVGKTVDFVAIMTYDEHYSGSPEPGPVASLGFVERSVRDALQLIPREKLIMGLPFYNRIWRVTADGHTISNTGMARPWALIEEWDALPVWDSEIGSYYVNFTDDYATYRIWLECERSISEKMRIFREHELAGVASWRRGLESPGVWQQIYGALD